MSTSAQDPQGPSNPVESLLIDCLELPAEERDAALQRACAEHPALAAELGARWETLRAMGLLDEGSDGRDAGSALDLELPGELGGFRLLDRLGEGGMGVVYRAEQRDLGREVALKIMRPESLFFDVARERFRREVEAIARLRHPGIVPVYAVGEDRGVPYFAMELLAGPTLAVLLRQLAGRTPAELSGADLWEAVGAPAEQRDTGVFALSWTDACCEIARQVAEALQHAHDQSTVHRDVKPSNVSVTPDGRARLFDFGLAASSEADRLTRSGSQLGTLHYLPPEQLRGERELDARADVYALGVTLYELLALDVPYAGDSRVAIEARILDGRPAPLRSRNRRVPPELEHVCAKAMELDPARRYATARELAEDLRRVLERRDVRARPAGPVLRLRRWAQRRPAWAVGLVAAVLVFVVVPSALLWRERQHSGALARSLAKETDALAAERDARTAERAALEEARTTVAFLDRVFLQQLPGEGGPGVLLTEAILAGLDALPMLDDYPAAQMRLSRSLGLVLIGLGANAEATDLLERALEARDRLDPDSPRAPDNLHATLATALSNLGQFDGAHEHATLALGELEAAGLGRSGEAAGATMTIGIIALWQGHFEEADQELRAARELFLALEDPFNATMSGTFLVGTLKRLGRPEEAIELIEALDAATAHAGGELSALRPRVLDQVAWARTHRGDFDGAQAAYREAIDLATGIFGSRSLDVLDVQVGLLELLHRRGQYASALELAREALSLATELEGPDSARARVVRAHQERLETRLGLSDR